MTMARVRFGYACREPPADRLATMFEGVIAGWPNGLHDAFLRTLTIDYTSARATLALNIWVGDASAATEAEREAYRPVTLSVSGLLWCIIESPESQDEVTAEGLWIDGGLLSDLKEKPNIPTVLGDAPTLWIYVREWNSFIYLAGREASAES